MESEYYVISTGIQSQQLKVKKSSVRTIRELKMEAVIGLNLAYDNIRFMKNGRTVRNSEQTELSGFIKPNDQLKMIPIHFRESEPDIKIDIKKQEEKHKEEEKKKIEESKQVEKQLKGMSSLQAQKYKEKKRIQTVKKMAEDHKIEMEARRKEMEDRKQYDHRDSNVYFKFARQDIDQEEVSKLGLHLPVPPVPKVEISDLAKAAPINYFDDPLKKQKDFMDPKKKKDDPYDPASEVLKNLGSAFSPDFMIRSHADPYSSFGRRGTDPNEPFKMPDSESQSEKQEQPVEEDDGPVLFGDETDPPRDPDPPEYVYRKQPPPNQTPEQKTKRCWMRLTALNIKDPDYWTHVSESNQEFGEAMSRSGAQFMEPIQVSQPQRHVMRMFLKRMKAQPKITQNLEYFKTIPGLLEYCFHRRLCYPVRPLKLLMEERKQQMCRIFRDWFEYNPDEVYSPQQQDQYTKSLNQYTDKRVVELLKPIVGSQDEALKLTEIAQNDFQAAVQFYLRGGKQRKRELLEEIRLLVLTDWEHEVVDLIEPWEEQMFLYRWYRKYESYEIRLRLQSQMEFLEIYTLSMKHLCPSLFRLLIKNVPFIRKLVPMYPAERIKPKRLPKKIKEVKYIRIIQV